jgi:UDP:flavonoid glycosyltransferase YjiC (YdhE family)
VIQPLAFDQFDNAARVRKLGVGTMIPKRWFRAPMIAQRVQGLLNSSDVNTQCQRMMNHFRGKDPLGESCHLIETTIGIA